MHDLEGSHKLKIQFVIVPQVPKDHQVQSVLQDQQELMAYRAMMV
jgi:hypothetical protein